jgi:hypothetical protein
MHRSIVALLVAMLVAGCARLAAPGSPSPTAQATPSIAPTPEATALPPAIDLLDCLGAPSGIGGIGLEFGPETAGETTDAALDSFLESFPATIPQSGYAKAFEDEEGAVYTYSFDDQVKVVIVVGTRYVEMFGSRWTIDELRSCDPTEYGPGVDMGEDTTVWGNADGRIIMDIVGPKHCGWQSIRILHVTSEGELVAQYIRDPKGVVPQAALEEPYAEGVPVPALYVVDASGVAERWPKTPSIISCM